MSWMEIIADRKIRDAQDEGAFDNLPGKGKPLRLDYDPRVPPELRTAYRLMKEANILPDWIQMDKEIRIRHEQWQERLRLFSLHWTESHDRRPATRSRQYDDDLDARRDTFLLDAARGLRELNRMIDRLNLIVPTPSRQRLRFPLADEMAALERQFPRLTPRTGGGETPWDRLTREDRPPTRLANRMPLRTRKDSFG